jgi:hypothetical protein
MKLNREWHLQHKLARNASLEERINWHMLHAENCQCREMPVSIRRELEARGWTAPTPRSLR